jgi:hypothetical protein
MELELPSAVPFRERLRAAGLGPDWVVTITDNRATMVSFRGQSVRIHRAYTDAPDEVVLAIARFVTAPRRSERREASRVILRHAPQESSPDAVPIRTRDRTHPADEPFVQRLTAAHLTYNRELFDGALKPVSIRVSRRMRRKLGHYSPAVSGLPAEIAIGRRHIRSDSWDSVLHTLLHEMVHQWQDEHGFALAHDRRFRKMARLVGADPRAVRRESGGQVPAPFTRRTGSARS